MKTFIAFLGTLAASQATPIIEFITADVRTMTRRWRGVDSNFRFRDALSSPTARPWSRRLIRW